MIITMQKAWLNNAISFFSPDDIWLHSLVWSTTLFDGSLTTSIEYRFLNFKDVFENWKVLKICYICNWAVEDFYIRYTEKQ